MLDSKRFKYFYPQINNCKQFVAISNSKPDLPIILFLHGGPGMVLSPILDSIFPGLEDNFQIVIWDQRGAGLSFNQDIDVKEMTLSQLIEDTRELVIWLQNQIKQEKVYLLGQSCGSTLGIYAVHKYPELFSGFISIGQWLVDENDRPNIEHTILKAKQIINNNPRLTVHQQEIISKVSENDRWLDDILIDYDYYPKVATDTWDYQMNLVENSSLYDEKDKQNYTDGIAFSDHLYEDIEKNYNVKKDIQSLSIKSLFLVGSEDSITPFQPTQIFVDSLLNSSQVKPQFKVLEGLRHYLFLENPELFKSILEKWC